MLLKFDELLSLEMNARIATNISMSSSEDTDVLEEVLTNESVQEENNLIVHNDEVNTFDHVINTLIRVCKHTNEQAEQCAYIIHFKGKCTVKTGVYELLNPMRESITSAGISASIY